MPTVQNLALELAEEWGESTFDSDYLKLVRTWIKDGFREIGDEAEWFFLKADETINTIAATATYRLASAVSYATKLRFTLTDEPIPYTPVEQLIERGLDMELQDKPQAWYISGYDSVTNQFIVKLWPIPGSIYSLQFIEDGRPLEIADADSIPMPANFLTILKDYVRAEQSRDDKDYENYDRMNDRWRVALDKRKKRFTKQPARKIRLKVSDITRSDRGQPFLRFPPTNFEN